MELTEVLKYIGDLKNCSNTALRFSKLFDQVDNSKDV